MVQFDRPRLKFLVVLRDPVLSLGTPREQQVVEQRRTVNDFREEACVP